MSLKIQIFEDDAGFRDLLTAFLELHAFDVRSYASPREHPLIRSGGCPCRAKQPCAQIIISDVHMPGMNGFELVGRLRENRCNVSRVALMSGSYTAELRRKAEDLGCKIFEKPFQMSEMLDWLRECEEGIGVRKAVRRFAQAG